MVSWADLLTLLFASLIVLYASASRHGLPSAASRSPLQATQKDDLSGAFERLRNALGNEIESDKLNVSLETRGIVVSLRDESYFQSGSDEIAPPALASIGRVAKIIRDLPNNVRLEGHSDSVPIHNARFRDNWGLSAARSAAVLTLLEGRFGIPGERLAIAAYAGNNPVAENESAEGRAQNRRVDIVILSQTNI